MIKVGRRNFENKTNFRPMIDFGDFAIIQKIEFVIWINIIDLYYYVRNSCNNLIFFLKSLPFFEIPAGALRKIKITIQKMACEYICQPWIINRWLEIDSSSSAIWNKRNESLRFTRDYEDFFLLSRRVFSQITAGVLIQFDGFEKSLEITSSESLGDRKFPK